MSRMFIEQLHEWAFSDLILLGLLHLCCIKPELMRSWYMFVKPPDVTVEAAAFEALERKSVFPAQAETQQG